MSDPAAMNDSSVARSPSETFFDRFNTSMTEHSARMKTLDPDGLLDIALKASGLARKHAMPFINQIPDDSLKYSCQRDTNQAGIKQETDRIIEAEFRKKFKTPEAIKAAHLRLQELQVIAKRLSREGIVQPPEAAKMPASKPEWQPAQIGQLPVSQPQQHAHG